MVIPAKYARYSTANQREESIEDQFAMCDRRAKTEDWPTPLPYSDAAMSGQSKDRNDFNRLQADAAAGRFNVLLVTALSRLGRDSAEREQLIKRLEFRGIRIIAVSEGYDSNLPLSVRKMHRGMSGIKDEAFIDDVARETHKGLTGKALQQLNAGGRSYGYRSVPVYHDSRLDQFGRPRVEGVTKEIDPEQAAVVVEIYEHYANGKSPHWIANELNRRGIPAPRQQHWARSAIYGDKRSGVGILSNPLYRGIYIWNRSKFIKDPDTGKRKRFERPESEWIIHEIPELQIISETLWARVQDRRDRVSNAATAQALAGKNTGGRNPKYLFSGILKCGICGSNYNMANIRAYGCSRHKERGQHACSNNLLVRRDLVEAKLLACIKSDLLSDDAVAYFKRETARLLAEIKKADTDTRTQDKIKETDSKIQNMITAIQSGAYSPALQKALENAEADKERLEHTLQAQQSMDTLPDILPNAVIQYRSLVADLENTLKRDVSAARQDIMGLVGNEITLIPEDGILVAELGTSYEGLIRLAAGKNANRVSETMVAGAGFEPTTFGL